MSISQLPPSTAHRLRSSHQLPDAHSFVKELVDNSIDAGATSIEITISPNTVDKIQVRDNGCGIQVEDFQYLGRRSHTSKLRHFDELHQNGGKTLGFRGEALASATETATIKITTRTAQDPVASLLQLKERAGGFSKKQPVSGPVGTTVQALNLFNKFTVRKQTAIKSSRKSLAEIQRLLESYVIAIPDLKLSFKVFNSSSQAWSYSPCSLSSTQEAITQVFGHALTAQLVEISSDTSTEDDATEEQPRVLSITALLPRPDSDVQVIKGKGAFISVDSRPISSARSTGKKLVSIFKSSISKILGSPDSSRAPSNPFVQISIQCPPGSYDPNVSQLKDEVMFNNEPAVLDCFQALCDTIYIKKVPASKTTQNKSMRAGSTLSPTTEASKIPRTNTRERSTPSKTRREHFPVDEDILGPLNDGFERLLLKNLGTLEDGGGAVPRAFTRSPSPSKIQHRINNVISDANQSEKIQHMMRPKLCINLSRRDSDSTDVDGTDGLVPVQVTPRRAASPIKESLPSHSRRRALASGRRSEDIGSYFRPVRDEPIVIATDETATPEDTTLEISLASPSETNRRPLKELTQSEVNTFQEEEEEEDFSDSESLVELSLAEPNIGPSPRTSPRRMARARMSNIPFQPLTRTQQPPSFNAGLELSPSLQTPPPSDPRRADNLARRDSRQNSANIMTRGQRSSQGNAASSVNRIGEQVPRQGRILLGSGPTASNDRRRSGQVGRGNGLASRRTAPASRDSSDVHLKDWLHNINTNSEDQEAPGHSRDQCNKGSNPRPAKRQRRHSSIATSTSEESDPRRLLIKRQRISTEGGRLKRIASKKLPFETIPQVDLTVKLSIKARIRMSELRIATWEFMSSGRAAEQDSAMQFSSMKEVDKVNELLKHTTEAWLGEDSSIEADYILRSGAKGKSKA
ncbi:unnamed protein product [Fusarium equiseti]|uniref:DNA mismatch repair protein S5 domain-containing protein n=1 Tax=Fusarium equiseti TaxID=61235 RepID=A0A8J2NA86_FUSEQ|nr:unnamed protein product [Fusarium equiseti]